MTTRVRPDHRTQPLGICPWTSAVCPLRRSSCYEPASRSCLIAGLYAAMGKLRPNAVAEIHTRQATLDGKALVQRFKLSPRELEVLSCLFEIDSDEAIAARLEISRHTVRGHRKAIYRKLEVSSFRQLVQRLGVRVRLEAEPKST